MRLWHDLLHFQKNPRMWQDRTLSYYTFSCRIIRIQMNSIDRRKRLWIISETILVTLFVSSTINNSILQMPIQTSKALAAEEDQETAYLRFVAQTVKNLIVVKTLLLQSKYLKEQKDLPYLHIPKECYFYSSTRNCCWITKRKECNQNVSMVPPIPTVTFSKNYTLQIGNETLNLDYYGVNHLQW